MEIKVKVDFGPETLAAINGLASALTGGNKPAANPLKSVPKPENASPEAAAPATEATTEKADKITVEQLRLLVTEKATDAAKKAALKEILKELGATNVSSLEPGKYVEFYTRVKAI